MPPAALPAAFPSSLRRDALAVVELLPPARLEPALPFRVVVAGEPVAIPHRIYHPELPAERKSGLSGTQLTILHCLYTRHHDGHVRERNLRQIVAATEPWVVPYVVQLIGEYVLPIVETIHHELTELRRPGTAYGRFRAENPSFVRLTSQRVASYWNCYHRDSYPRLRDYPGHVLLASLDQRAAVGRPT